MMIQATSIVSRAKSKWYKPKKVMKLALNSQFVTVQILTNDAHVRCSGAYFVSFLFYCYCTY